MKTIVKIQIVCIVAFLCGALQQAIGQTSIRLADDEVLVTEDTITVGDIASVESDSNAAAAAINKIDVEVFAESFSEIVITRQQLRIRLMLAGYTISEDELLGPKTVNVRRIRRKDVRRSIEVAIRRQIVEQFGIAPDDLQVSLDPRFKDPIGAAGFSSVTVAPWSRPDLPLGRRSLSLTAATAHGSLTFKAPVSIAVIREIAIASVEIPPGTELSTKNTMAARRPVSTKSNSYLTLDQAIGRTSRSSIGKYGVIQSTRLQVARAPSDVVIARNSLVNVVVQRGPLTVTLRDVKAMTDGKKGDRIQLLNPHTSERMSAKVVDAHTARMF